MGCDRPAAGSEARSKFEREFGKPGIVELVKSGNRIFQARWWRWRAKKSFVKERNFRGDRKTGRRRAPHVIAVNMHDVEVTLDFLDEGIEPLRKDINVVELDSD